MPTIRLLGLMAVWLAVRDGAPTVLYSGADGGVYLDSARVGSGRAFGLGWDGSKWLTLVGDDSGLKLGSEQVVPGAVRSAALAVDAQRGVVHLAWLRGNVLEYSSGGKVLTIPPLPNFDQFAGPIDLQLDAEGKPGVVFVLGGEGNSVGFWRPGRGTARVIDARGQEADDADVRLAFEGTSPRVFFYGQIDDSGKGVSLAKSSDDGLNWESAFRIPAVGRMLGVVNAVVIGSAGMASSPSFQRFTKAPLPFEATEAAAAKDGADLYVAYRTADGVRIWKGH